MEEVFQNVLTASFHGSIVIAAVLVLRLALKKTPKKFLCLLWLLAGIRLLMPFEIRSDLSLQPAVEDIPYVAEIRQEEPVPETRPQQSDYPVRPTDPAVPEYIPEGYYEMVLGQSEPENRIEKAPEKASPDWLSLIPWVWLAVACCFGVYTIFSYITLKVRVRDAIKISGGWESDRIETAFILGFIRPKIYIPVGLPLSVRRHILAHERTHLEKGDHWFKMVGFLALAVHWFNPLVWAAYILLCKDIEIACDERVVQFMDLEERKSYSAALLCCSTNKVHFAACPVAFGEVSVKERIMKVLHYKKPGFWISLLGVLAVIFVAVCLLTSPAEEPVAPPPEEVTAPTEAASETVTVKNADELLSAIGSNTEIIMEPGAYILSESENYGKAVSDFCRWEERYDGYELTLVGVENLTIRGSGMHVTTLETDPRYANVLGLQGCTNVALEDFTAGHTRDRGECGGGVIDLVGCENVTVNRMGIFGCGVIGLQADGCVGVTLTDSDVYDCSSSAVNLFWCHDVAVSGNRIYNIGDELYGGYTYFDIQGCTEVFIENNELSDSNLNNLLSAADSNVLLKNNLFRSNRPQDCAFSGSEHCITMDGNRFEDNVIRKWYSYVEICKDADGKVLTEQALNRLYGVKAEEPSAPQLEIHVSTVDEFIAAIGPDREIILDESLYDLSTATGYGISGGEYYCWEDIYDGPGLVICNVSNMTIRSNDGKYQNHTISAVPRYADVLLFQGCADITVSGITAGHTKEQGSCAGGVLEFRDCDRITVDNCGLFGCGILGIQADYCSSVVVQNCEIYECSQGGIQLWNVDGAVIEGTSFRDIGGDDIMSFSNCTNVTVDGNRILGENPGSDRIQTNEQRLIGELSSLVNNFAQSYLNGDAEGVAFYTAGDFAAEPYVTQTENSFPNVYWFEATMRHVETLMGQGSLKLEVPFVEWTYDSEKEPPTWYLLVTVVLEDGAFKVSNCVIER